jgi:hypothetical protein
MSSLNDLLEIPRLLCNSAGFLLFSLFYWVSQTKHFQENLGFVDMQAGLKKKKKPWNLTTTYFETSSSLEFSFQI